jgi:hypothetical protein
MSPGRDVSTLPNTYFVVLLHETSEYLSPRRSEKGRCIAHQRNAKFF